MIKVLTLVGTRPELIRLSALISAIDHDNAFEHVFVHTGQNAQSYLRDTFFEDLNLRHPDITWEAGSFIDPLHLQTIEHKLIALCHQFKPNYCLVLGDTYSAKVALIVRKLGVRLIHLEAGNRCYDPLSPEEKNRKLLDQQADINGCYSHESLQHLLEEQCLQSHFVTGSPLREVYRKLEKKMETSTILEKLDLQPQSYFIWSTHRAENVDHPEVFQRLLNTLENLTKTYPSFPIWVTGHPRFIDRLNAKEWSKPSQIKLHEPFRIVDYLRLMKDSLFVLSDSGSLNEEADIVGFHGINLRQSHERDEAEKFPITTLSHFDWEIIQQTLEKKKNTSPLKNRVEAYRVGDFSSRVIQFVKRHYLETRS